MLIDDVLPQSEPTDGYSPKEQEGIELVRLRLEQIQRLRVQLWQLARIPRSRRNSLICDEYSLAVYRLSDAQFHLKLLTDRLRWLQLQRKGEEMADAARLAAPTAPGRPVPATT